VWALAGSPGTCNELNDSTKKEECAIEEETCSFPVRTQQSIQHLKPLSPKTKNQNPPPQITK